MTPKSYYNSYYKSYTNNYYLTYAYINSVPSAANTANFGISYVTSSNGVEFVANRPNSNFKTQVLLYQNYTPAGSTTFNSYSSYVGCAANTVYRYCARYCYTNSDNGQTYYGGWSGLRAFEIPYFFGKAKSNKKGFTMKIKRAANVSYYNLYVNDRFVKRLSTKKAAKTFTIKKRYSKRRYNTIKLVPVIAGYGESDVWKSGSLYIWK